MDLSRRLFLAASGALFSVGFLTGPNRRAFDHIGNFNRKPVNPLVSPPEDKTPAAPSGTQAMPRTAEDAGRIPHALTAPDARPGDAKPVYEDTHETRGI